MEEAAESDRQRLEAERRGLEEKATFLHFTQSQLNEQLLSKESEVEKLSAAKGLLDEEMAALQLQLEGEKERMREVESVYVRENAEAEIEFKKLKQEKEKLLAEKFALITQVYDFKIYVTHKHCLFINVFRLTWLRLTLSACRARTASSWAR